MLEENCEIRGTDNVQGQIFDHISHQMVAIVFILIHIIFTIQAVLKIGECSLCDVLRLITHIEAEIFDRL